MAVHNVEISTENLLNIVSQLPEKEFQLFVKKAEKLRNKSVEARWTKREVEIIKEINECILSPEKQNRYDNLVKKRQDEKISQVELEELIALTDETEELNVKRLENLVRLALSSGKSVDEIIDELELRQPTVR
jgi:hypothetical protein